MQPFLPPVVAKLHFSVLTPSIVIYSSGACKILRYAQPLNSDYSLNQEKAVCFLNHLET